MVGRVWGTTAAAERGGGGGIAGVGWPGWLGCGVVVGGKGKPKAKSQKQPPPGPRQRETPVVSGVCGLVGGVAEFRLGALRVGHPEGVSGTWSGRKRRREFGLVAGLRCRRLRPDQNPDPDVVCPTRRAPNLSGHSEMTWG